MHNCKNDKCEYAAAVTLMYFALGALIKMRIRSWHVLKCEHANVAILPQASDYAHTASHLHSCNLRRLGPPELAMVSVNALISELAGLEPFVESQIELGADADMLRSAQATVIKCKINAIKGLDYADATRLTSAIGAIKWSKDIQRAIGDAVTAKMNESVDSIVKSNGRKLPPRCQQECNTVELYLTERHWKPLDDAATPWSVKIHSATQACEEIQLLLPSETTRSRITEILLASAGLPTVHDKAFFKLYDQVSTSFAKLQKVVPAVTHLASFPTDPRLLPPNHFKHTYPNPSNQPAMRQLQEVGAGGGVRKNSKDYKAAHGAIADKKHVPTICLPSAPEPTMEGLCGNPQTQQMLFGMLAQVWGRMNMQGSGASASSGGQPFGTHPLGGHKVDVPRPPSFGLPPLGIADAPMPGEGGDVERGPADVVVYEEGADDAADRPRTAAMHRIKLYICIYII